MKSMIAAMAAMVVLAGCGPGDVYEYEVVMRNGVTNVVEAGRFRADADVRGNIKSVRFLDGLDVVARFNGDVMFVRRGRLVRPAADRQDRQDRRDRR